MLIAVAAAFCFSNIQRGSLVVLGNVSVFEINITSICYVCGSMEKISPVIYNVLLKLLR